MIILIIIAIVSGWITLIHLTVRNEVRFEDEQIEEMREFRERGKRWKS